MADKTTRARRLIAPRGYVLATRVWRGTHYLTRYYVGMTDGRPRVGPKKRAPRFSYTDAGTIRAQLSGFIAFPDIMKPPRAGAWPKFRTNPVQGKIDDDAPLARGVVRELPR